MNFLKKNALLISILAGFLLGLGVSIYFLSRKIKERSDVAGQLSSKKDQRRGLWERKPSLIPDNVERIRSDAEEEKKLTAETLAKLRKSWLEFEPIGELKAKEEIYSACRRMVELLDRNSIKHPDKYQFGFDRYASYPPRKEDTPTLQEQMRITEELVKLAANNSIQEFSAIRRVVFEEARPSGSPGPVRSSPDKEPLLSTGGEMVYLDPRDYLYTVMPFEIEFVCETDALRKFMIALSRSDFIFVPRILNFENEKKEPMRGTTAAPKAASKAASPAKTVPSPQRGNVPEEIREIAQTDPDELPYVMGEERIKVGMRIDWLKFRPRPPTDEDNGFRAPMNIKAITSFLTQYYERVIAVVVLLVMVIFSAGLVIQVSGLKIEIKKEDESRPAVAAVKPIDLQKLKDTLALLDDPPSWVDSDPSHRLFIAPYMKVLDPRDPWPQPYDPKIKSGIRTPDGILFEWLRKFGISPTMPNVGSADPDGDGFTTREEYGSGLDGETTDPTDLQSRPNVALKLRSAQLVRRPFAFLFTSVQEATAGTKFGIRRRDGAKAFFLLMNEVIPDRDTPGWKITNYTPKTIQVPNPRIKGPDGKPALENVDVSELTLEKEGAKPIILVKGQQGTTNDVFIKLYFILENRSFEVGEEAGFSLQGNQYQVVTIKQLDDNRSEVIVKDLKSEKTFKLLPLTQTDLNRSRNSSTNPTTPEGFPPPKPAGPAGFQGVPR